MKSKKATKELEKMQQVINNIITEKTKLPTEKIKKIFKKAEILKAGDALEMGLVDKVI